MQAAQDRSSKHEAHPPPIDVVIPTSGLPRVPAADQAPLVPTCCAGDRDCNEPPTPSRLIERWDSDSGITQSRHSRRIVPITRSQIAFAFGQRGGDLTARSRLYVRCRTQQPDLVVVPPSARRRVAPGRWKGMSTFGNAHTRLSLSFILSARM